MDDSGFANYKTIGEAVVAASDGDTVYLKPGTYSESFTLNKSLKLMPLTGEEGDIILNGDGKNVGITITADGCSVEGLTIQNFKAAGIKILSTGNIIQNNIFEKDNPAVLVQDSNKNAISGNHMKDCLGGVALVEGSSENTVASNDINGGTLSIILRDGGANRIISNNATDASMGIWLMNSSNIEMSGNDINSKTLGVWIFNSSASKLEDNVVVSMVRNIFLQNTSGIGIYNSSMNGAEFGVRLENSSKSTIEGCNINNSMVAIHLEKSPDNTLVGNSVLNTKDTAVEIGYSNNNTFTDNQISKGERGILIIYSSANKLHGNKLKEIKHGLYVESMSPENFNNYIDESNEMDGVPIAYFYGQSGKLVQGKELAHLTLAYCDNFTVEKNNITSDALILFNSRDNKILNNNISRSYGGMFLLDSRGNSISGNKLLSNNYSGLFLDNSDYNEVGDNVASGNNQMGISLRNSEWNIIRDNTVDHNYETGIWLLNSSGNTIRDNTVDHNSGTGIWFNLSSDNRIFENNISSNPLGLQLTYSMNNSIYHNNLIGNKLQAEDREGDNHWDMGNVTGGNYWSDHTAKGNPSTSWPKPIRGAKKDNYPFQDINGWLNPKPAAKTLPGPTITKAKRSA